MIRKIVTLAKGSLVAQVVTFLSGIFLAKLYSPSDFGQLGVYVSLYAILSGVYSLKLEQSIMIQENDRKVDNVLAVSMTISVFLLVVFVMLWSGITKTGIIPILDEYAYLSFAVILSGFLYSWILIGHQLLIRDEIFRKSAFAKMLLPMLASFFQIVLFYIGDSSGLITGQLIALFIVMIFLLSGRIAFFRVDSIVKIRRIGIVTIHRNKSFPLYVLPNYIFNTLSVNLPSLLFSTFYGLNVAGFYMMAQRLIASPMSVFTGSVYQVFYQEASVLFREKKDIFPLIKKTITNQFKLGVIPFVIVMMISPWAFEVALGKEWREAGLYSSILSFWLFLVFINSPVTSVINIIGVQRFYFIFEVFGFITRLLAIIIVSNISSNPIYAVMAFSAAGILINLLLTYLIMYKFKRYYYA